MSSGPFYTRNGEPCAAAEFHAADDNDTEEHLSECDRTSEASDCGTPPPGAARETESASLELIRSNISENC